MKSAIRNIIIAALIGGVGVAGIVAAAAAGDPSGTAPALIIMGAGVLLAIIVLGYWLITRSDAWKIRSDAWRARKARQAAEYAAEAEASRERWAKQQRANEDYWGIVRLARRGVNARTGKIIDVSSGDRRVYPLAGAVAKFEVGVQQTKVDMGKVVGATVLFGVIGTVAASNSKKDLTRLWIEVTTTEGAIKFDVPASEERAARTFVAEINDNAGVVSDAEMSGSHGG